MPAKSFADGFSKGFGRQGQRGYLQLATLATPGVGNSGAYQDGDIISAVSWRRVRHMKAEEHSFKRGAQRRAARINGNGHVPHDDAANDFCETCCQYRFVFLPGNALRKTRLSDLVSVDFPHNTDVVDILHRDPTKVTNKDVKAMKARHLKTWLEPNARGAWTFQDDALGTVTGEPLALYWYGGRTDCSHDNLDIVWPALEGKLGIDEATECTEAPFGDYKKKLTITVDDFDDETGGLLSISQSGLVGGTDAVTIDSIVTTGDVHDLTISPGVDLDDPFNPRTGVTDANGNLFQIQQSESTSTVLQVLAFLDDPNVTPPVPVTGAALVGNLSTVNKRKNHITWRDLRDTVEADVNDPKKAIRIDQIRKHVRQQIVLTKT